MEEEHSHETDEGVGCPIVSIDHANMNINTNTDDLNSDHDDDGNDNTSHLTMDDDDDEEEKGEEENDNNNGDTKNHLNLIPPPASWYEFADTPCTNTNTNTNTNAKENSYVNNSPSSSKKKEKVETNVPKRQNEEEVKHSENIGDCSVGGNNDHTMSSLQEEHDPIVLKRHMSNMKIGKDATPSSTTSTTRTGTGKSITCSPKKALVKSKAKAMIPSNINTKTKTKTKSSKKSKKTSISKTKALKKNAKAIKQITTDTITEVIPNAAQELIYASAQKAYHYTRLSYSTSKLFGKFHLSNSEVGNRLGGYDRETIRSEGIRDVKTNEVLWMDRDAAGYGSNSGNGGGGGSSSSSGGSVFPTKKAKKKRGQKDSGFAWEDEWDKARICLPPFSSLPWVDRQLVKEWRTCDYLTYDSRPAKGLQERDDKLDTTGNPDLGAIAEEKVGMEAEEYDYEYDMSMVEEFEQSHEQDFEQARTLQPQPMQKPPWENASSCYACRKPFASSSALLRHHCRLCGRSYCQTHSRWSHRLPHLGYSPDVPERVCATCKQVLESQNLAERIAWRMARCRDYLSPRSNELCPYFETGVDTVEDAAARLTKAAIHFAKSIPLGAQATVAVETLDVLRKHGLKGVYGLILRKEFMAAADLLCKVTGINKKVWPLSVHELSAAIFYALAQHRALRGVDPEREHRIHALKIDKSKCKEVVGGGSECDKDCLLDGNNDKVALDEIDNAWSRDFSGSDDDDGGERNNALPAPNMAHPNVQEAQNILVDETDKYDPTFDEQDNLDLKEDSSGESSAPQLKKIGKSTQQQQQHDSDQLNDTTERTLNREGEAPKKDLPFDPVCEPVSDKLLSSLIFYAPLALNFIYATTEVDMQLLAAQQSWRLVYAHLNQDVQVSDKPASALFVHSEQKIACFAVRGTASINDVVTDIRAMPVQFPDSDMDGLHEDEEGWTPVMKGQGLALCGMAGAACNLFRENIDALLLLARQGYRIRLTGHSLGGSVGALLGALIKRHFEFHLTPELANQQDILHVYSYGSPACVDAKLSDYAQSYVTNCVLHDDCIPRLTPTSIRALLKHLLYIRETWVKEHLTDDLMAITERAKTAWAPKLRNGFTLMYTVNPSIKVYKKLKAGGKSLRKKMKKGKKKLKSIAKSNYSHSVGEGNKERESDVPKTILTTSISTNDMSCTTALEGFSESDNEEIDGEEDDGGLFFDGDCFYEAEESLLEHSDDEDSVHGKPPEEKRDPSLDEWVPFDEPLPEELCDMVDNKEKDDKSDKEGACTEAVSSAAVMLAETPLPRMFIPGKIVHLYTHRGAFKAAIVPRAFRELRRITLAGSLLNDHMSKSYYEGLLECKSVREARKDPPEWTGFGDEKTCCCCASRFTWASTSDNEAQEARDRHNCRACGGLVCDSCSKNRVPIVNIGIHLPSRVCDRCYNDMGGILSSHDAMARSFISNDEKSQGNVEEDEPPRTARGAVSMQSGHDGDDFKIDKQQDSKRNHVVDELAMRMPSAATR